MSNLCEANDFVKEETDYLLDLGVCFFQQPIICSETKEIVGFENLVRRRIGTDEYQGAFQTLTDIRKNKQTAALDYLALSQAAAMACDSPHFFFTANVHATTLCDPVWCNRMLLCLFKRPTTLFSNLVIEITESDSISDLNALQDNSNMLAKRGVQFAIDDFGDGFGCLKLLRNTPVRVIKFSREALISLEHLRETPAFRVHQAIVAEALRAGMKVIGEGVETEYQEKIALELGVPFLQGYRYGKPVARD